LKDTDTPRSTFILCESGGNQKDVGHPDDNDFYCVIPIPPLSHHLELFNPLYQTYTLICSFIAHRCIHPTSEKINLEPIRRSSRSSQGITSEKFSKAEMLYYNGHLFVPFIQLDYMLAVGGHLRLNLFQTQSPAS
jgi:hypothetical protein